MFSELLEVPLPERQLQQNLRKRWKENPGWFCKTLLLLVRVVGINKKFFSLTLEKRDVSKVSWHETNGRLGTLLGPGTRRFHGGGRLLFLHPYNPRPPPTPSGFSTRDLIVGLISVPHAFSYFLLFPEHVYAPVPHRGTFGTSSREILGPLVKSETLNSMWWLCRTSLDLFCFEVVALPDGSVGRT